MSLAGRVLSELEEGRWTMASIAPSFRRRLEKEVLLDGSDKNISELCLSFYSKTSPDLISISSDKDKMNLSDLSDSATKRLQNIFKEDYRDSKLIEFEPEVSKTFQAAIEIIKNTDSSLSALMKDHVTGFLRVGGVNFRSASHPQAFGIIFLGDGVQAQNDEQLAVSIVHEYAHQELFLVNLLDRLVNQSFDYHEIHAPFQGKKRPPIGRLHSLWALYRMVQFQKRQGNVSEKYQRLLGENVVAFQENELTHFGEKLVQLVKKEASL